VVRLEQRAKQVFRVTGVTLVLLAQLARLAPQGLLALTVKLVLPGKLVLPVRTVPMAPLERTDQPEHPERTVVAPWVSLRSSLPLWP